jgi:hypothetical protein
MATSDDLLQDVYANFLSAYARNQTSSSPDVLAFEAIGLSPGLSAGDPTSPALAVEYVSTLADALPDLSSGVYARTMRTVSGTYSDILSVAAPCTQTGAPTFNAAKASATEALNNSTLGSEEGPTTFEPAYALPTDWYDPSKSANWMAYSYDAGAAATGATATSTTGSPNAGSTTAQTGSGGTVVPRYPIRYMGPIAPWRLMVAAPGTAAASSAVAAHPPASPPAAAPAAAPRPVSATMARPMPEMMLRRPFPLPQPVPVVPASPTSSPQAPLHPSFSMSFEYCIVELNRPWLSGDFLAAGGWYVPGAHQGDYASGPVPAASTPNASTATSPGAGGAPTQPTGPFAYVPTAFIAIKNLTIDVAALENGAASSGPLMAFGPFSLANATGTTDALSAPGIQIIGWICSVQPQLPPQTDPALVPAPPPTGAQTTQNTVGTVISDIGEIAGLFGGSKN